jgi:hypothetical protein
VASAVSADRAGCVVGAKFRTFAPSRENALVTLCRTLRPTGLLNALLALLSEERVLLVGSDPLVLFRAAEALANALAPIDFCGALVPILPDGLHPSHRLCSTRPSSLTSSGCIRCTTRS